jgi:hypothetical protein
MAGLPRLAPGELLRKGATDHTDYQPSFTTGHRSPIQSSSALAENLLITCIAAGVMGKTLLVEFLMPC